LHPTGFQNLGQDNKQHQRNSLVTNVTSLTVQFYLDFCSKSGS